MHGELSRFKDNSLKRLKKGDFLIICGDFGFVWDNSDKEKKALKKISKKKFSVLFIDGINENHALLESYPETDFSGGKAYKISENIYRLKNGEVYLLGGKKFLTIGGGESDENFSDFNGEYIFSESDSKNLEEKLKQHSNTFDYIITHDAPTSIKQFLEITPSQFGNISDILEDIFKNTSYSRWFFGKYHLDKPISYKLYAVYLNTHPIYDTQENKKKKARP